MSSFVESARTASRMRDDELVRSVFGKIAADLTRLMDREVRVWDSCSLRVVNRPAGYGKTHVSFRLLVLDGQEERYGSILVPLPDAVALGLSLLMVGDQEIDEAREWTRLDRVTKEALLEVGRFVTASVDDVIRRFDSRCSVGFAGCQGVRANVRPAFPHAAGEELLAGFSHARIDAFPAFDLLAILPVVAD